MYFYHPHLTGRDPSDNQSTPPSGYHHNTTASPSDVAHFFQTTPRQSPLFPLNAMENTGPRHSGAKPVISPNSSTVHNVPQTIQSPSDKSTQLNSDKSKNDDKSQILDENDPAVIISQSIPPLFELMPTNPKFWTLLARLQGVSLDQLAFPYKQLAQGIIPEVKDVPPIDSFNYFSVNYDKHLNTIVDSLPDLYNVLINLPLSATWFPVNNYADANWYSLEGHRFVDGFTFDDLQWYLQNVLNINQSSPSTPNNSVPPNSFTPDAKAPPMVQPMAHPAPAVQPLVQPAPAAQPYAPPAPPVQPPVHPGPTFQPMVQPMQQPMQHHWQQPQTQVPPPAPHPMQRPIPTSNFTGTHQHVPNSNYASPYGFASGLPFSSPISPGNFYAPASGAQIPISPWSHPAPAGFTNMLFKEKEIILPKWNGDSSGWHNMHTRLEVSNKLYLLNETATNSANAADSKLLARAFWTKFSDNALLPFSAQTEKYLNKGIEMHQELQGIYSPDDEPTLLSLSKNLHQIKMQPKESIISFVNRIRTVNKDLTTYGQPWPETSLTLLAIQGLDHRRYSDLTKSFLTGTHSASTFTRLTQIVTSYNKLNNIAAGSDYHTANAASTSP